jgi:hypothetical protein
MELIKIAGVALALLMVTGTAAAMPGAAPAQADENTDVNETDVDDDANETDVDDESAAPAGPSDRRNAAQEADRGPPADLPSQVPDFVGDLHDTIGQFLDGDLGGPLGEAISDLTPGDDSDTDEASTATPTPTAQAGA